MHLEQILAALRESLEKLEPYGQQRSEFRVALTRLKEAYFWIEEGRVLLKEEGPGR